MRNQKRSQSPYVRHQKAPYQYTNAYKAWHKAACYPSADPDTLAHLSTAHWYSLTRGDGQ